MNYAFIEPSTDEEVLSTKKVEKLVDIHFHDLISNTSPRMGKILQKLIVRTKWDSSSRDKYGEYYGVPAPKESPHHSGVLPAEIVIFAHPLIRDFPDEAALSGKVRIVLVHEIGHHLGLSEATLRSRNIF